MVRFASRAAYRAASHLAAHIEQLYASDVRARVSDLRWTMETGAPLHVHALVAHELQMAHSAQLRWRARRIRWAGRADGLISMAAYAPAGLDANGAEVAHG